MHIHVVTVNRETFLLRLDWDVVEQSPDAMVDAELALAHASDQPAVA